MGDFEYLRFEIGEDSVATVWLDRPPVNAVNQAMYREIRALFERLGADPAVNAIVLTGSGRHFCAGNDLEEFRSLDPENSPERMREVREAFWAIDGCAVPVIAAVHGVAVGTGLALVACCDFAIAAGGAELGVPEIAVGVMGAAKHLSRLVPQPMVRSMFYSGKPVPAEQIEQVGGLLAIVPAESLVEEAQERARGIVAHSPVAIRYAKRALNQIEAMGLREGYELEQGLTGELSAYADSKEAVNALLERRPPRYTGS